MKILTVVKTPDFTSIIMYASIDIYIRTADGLLNLGGGAIWPPTQQPSATALFP